jgi:AraC family transcriptional regulator
MEWAELGTGRTADLIADSTCLSSGRAWKGMSLQLAQVQGGGETPEGYSLNHALVLTTSGRTGTERRLEGSSWKSVPTQPMTVEFLPAGMPFAIRWQGPSDAIVLEVAPSLVVNVLGPERSEPQFRFWSSTDDALLIETLLALRSDVRAGFPCGSLYGEGLGASVVAQVVRNCATMPKTLARSRIGLSPRRLRMVLDYLQDNLEGDLSLQRLAGLANMSLDGFIRVFKQSMGVPPHQYVLRKRVERAQALLGNRSLSLTEVSLRSGFGDQSHFSRTFHRLIGLTPRHYRTALR